MFIESNGTVPNSLKMTIFIAILLGTYSNTLCMVEQHNNNFVFSEYFRGPIPVWMEKRIVPISVSSKILFLQAIIKTPLQTISGSSLQGDVLFKVLIDNCVVLLVNVYAVFIVHGGLTLITLKNKKTTLPL